MMRLYFAVVLTATVIHAAPATRPAWLGLAFTHHRIGDEQWLVVRYVFPSGPAQQAGVQPGDVVTAINGKPLWFRDSVELLEALSKIRPGARTHFGIKRGKRHIDAVLVPARMNDDQYARWRELRARARQRK